MPFCRFTNLRFPLALMALGAAAGCSLGDDAAHGTGDGLCHVVLTGTLTRVDDCVNPAVGMYFGATNRGEVSFAWANDGDRLVAVSIAFNGPVTKSTHSSTAGDIEGGITVGNGLSIWEAMAGVGVVKTGSFSLTITSVTQVQVSADAIRYTAHGRLTGTLQPSTGPSSGHPVMLTATF